VTNPAVAQFVGVAERYARGRPLETVLELGARDCAETLELHRLLPQAAVYAFECNPATLPVCRAAVAGLRGVHLIEEAVSDVEGESAFFAIDPERTRTTWADGNPGASSLLRASGRYPVEDYVQSAVTVATTRLDTFLERHALHAADLVWMDIQGAELAALRGLGRRLESVLAIHLEVEFMEIYQRQPLFVDVKRFLNGNGFLLHGFTALGEYSADAVFINSRGLPLRARAELLARDRAVGAAPRTGRIGRGVVEVVRQSDGDPSLAARRMLELGWLAYGRRLAGLDVNMRGRVPNSALPLDLLVPVGSDDLDVLPAAIASWRNHLRHPIRAIHVVAQPGPEVQGVCDGLGVELVDEAAAVAISRSDIGYRPDGVDRSGWLFQQLVKLSADEITGADHVLVADADTVLLRPQVFEHRGRIILNQSDEYHRPYRDAYRRLLGEDPRSVISFVSHAMVLSRATLRRLRGELEERHGMRWDESILAALDQDEVSGFSEYELYGNYCLARGVAVERAYWFNVSLPRSQVGQLDEISARWGGRRRSVSFHAWHT
jgi:FkbM family methyltransferase